jgi:hypothetical protein
MSFLATPEICRDGSLCHRHPKPPPDTLDVARMTIARSFYTRMSVDRQSICGMA